MFISKKYEEKGFVPSHPLFFMTEVHIQKAASLLLKIFVNKNLYPHKIKEAMLNLRKIPVKSLTASGKLIKTYMLDLNNKKELKSDMLFIYERTLAGVLKRHNITVAEKAENECKLVAADLFNEEAWFLFN